MKKNLLIQGLIIMTLIVISLTFFSLGIINNLLWASVIISVFLLKFSIDLNKNYITLTSFFVLFHILYGLSAPINIEVGVELHPLFSKPYNTNTFLEKYLVATLGLVIGFSLLNLIKKNSNKKITNITSLKYKNYFYIFALLNALIASTFELINMYRIGGVQMLFLGKAIYQSKVSALFLTLPSEQFMSVSIAFLGIYHSTKLEEPKTRKPKIIRYLLLFSLMSPFLVIKVILGQRGALVTLFIAYLASVTVFKPLKKISFKLFLFSSLFYLFMAFMVANRAIVHTIISDPQYFYATAFQKQRILKALNPGSVEFAAPFGNFNEFLNKSYIPSEPLFGKSYLVGLVNPIPSFLYPRKKPQQITYFFRDTYFPSEALRGAIAGTAYSSILEAYMNFRTFGVFIMYIVYGYLLQKFDKKSKQLRLKYLLLYITSFSSVITFHRSALGTVFGEITIKFFVIVLNILWLFILNNIFMSRRLNHK